MGWNKAWKTHVSVERDSETIIIVKDGKEAVVERVSRAVAGVCRDARARGDLGRDRVHDFRAAQRRLERCRRNPFSTS